GDIFENIAPELAESRSRAVAQIQRCRPRAIFIQGFVDSNESFRIGKRQRTQQRAFDDGEDRSVCTNPERERQDSDESEPRRLTKRPKTELEAVHAVTA